MRMKGMSYSQIKKDLGVSKGALSVWLRDYPLSEERLRALRDHSEIRIEKYRETRRHTREARWEEMKVRSAADIGILSKREIMIAGLFLYWGEGGKTESYTTTLSNTDPVMLRFYIQWLQILGVPKEKIRARVHLYADMDIDTELSFWSKELGLPISAFRKSYVKQSTRSALTYKQKFTHGTCNVIYDSRDTAEYVLSALEYLRETIGDGVAQTETV